MKQSFDRLFRGRITIVLLFFFVAFLLLLGRLFILQIVEYREFANLASRQHQFAAELQSERGTVYVRDKGEAVAPLALNRTVFNIIVSPREVEDSNAVVAFLSREFSADETSLLEVLSRKDDPYEVVLRRIESTNIERVRERTPRGIYYEEEMLRVYPHGSFAAHILGFVSKETDQLRGRYGLERYYEALLAGEKGFLEGVKDAAGFWIALGRRIVNPSSDGSDVYLTVDFNIQRETEKTIDRILGRWGADSGVITVVEPRTGKILALVARPEFDPNFYFEVDDFSDFLNPVVESTYELGSVIKPITMAGALEDGLVRSDSTYNDTGFVTIADYTIRNFDGKAYHMQTMTNVLEKSLNTGAIYVARLLGPDRQHEYLKKFGFGETTGIDLPGEVSGNISNLDLRRPIDFATASFGQGIAMTPLQLTMAMGAIANDGRLMRPYVIDRIIDGSGNETYRKPQEIRQVISRDSAEEMTKMLISAVRNGFENRAGVEGYFVAGKTGTAQIPRSDKPGYTDDVIHTFVGYAPAFDPRFLIYIQINRPSGNRFAANTLTPAFHDLAEYILNYYEVPPDER